MSSIQLKRRLLKNPSQGALLIEVLLTIVILSVGLVLIIRSLMVSLRSMVYTEGYSVATLLAEDKMAELAYQGAVEEDLDQSGTFMEPYQEFLYELQTRNIKKNEKPGPLNEATLKVQWTSGRKKHSITTTSFFPRKIQ